MEERKRKGDQTLDVVLAVEEVDRLKHFEIDVGARVLRTNNQVIEHVNDHLLELAFGVLDQRVSLKEVFKKSSVI